MPAEMIYGDITKQDQIQIVAHQCNCVTTNSAHLAKTMFEVFPWADIYKERESKVINTKNFPKGEGPGDIKIRGNGKDQRYVANMLGQVFPGKPRYPDSATDGLKARVEHFKSCLKKLAKVKGLKSVAFPWGIGCGAAGNDWPTYQKIINVFADEADQKGVEVFIVKLEG